MNINKNNPVNKIHNIFFKDDIHKVSDIIISIFLVLLVSSIFIISIVIINNFLNMNIYTTFKSNFLNINEHFLNFPSLNHGLLRSIIFVVIYILNLWLNSFGLTILIVMLMTMFVYPFSSYIRKILKGTIDLPVICNLDKFPTPNYSWFLLLLIPFLLIGVYISILSIPSIIMNIVFMIIKDIIVKYIKKIEFKKLINFIKNVDFNKYHHAFRKFSKISIIFFKICYIILGFIIAVKLNNSVENKMELLKISLDGQSLYKYIFDVFTEISKVHPYSQLDVISIKESISYMLFWFGLIFGYIFVYVIIFMDTKYFKYMSYVLSFIYISLCLLYSETLYYFLIHMTYIIISFISIILFSLSGFGIVSGLILLLKKINKDIVVRDNIAKDILKLLKK